MKWTASSARSHDGVESHDFPSLGSGTGSSLPLSKARSRPDDNPREEIVLSAIRTFFIVLALSFHSVIEGMALGLERETAGVWMNFGALAMHKFVIAFSVGVELFSTQACSTRTQGQECRLLVSEFYQLLQVSSLKYSVSILVFSFAPAIGILVALAVTNDSEVDADRSNEVFVQVLQGW